MEPEAREIHVLRRSRAVQEEQYVLALLGQVGADTFPFPVLEQPLEALVPKPANHR
jgi:hypothetical protein